MIEVTVLIAVAALLAGMALLLRGDRRRRGSKALGITHRDYSGPVLDPQRTLENRKLISAEVSIRQNRRASVKLICSDGSYVAFPVDAQ